MKSNKSDDGYRTEDDFLTDLFLGDIHFYLRNTATSLRDFTEKESVIVGNSSTYRLKSIDFNKITDDKIKFIIFYKILKFTFYENNLRRLINCPAELKFFMYGDNKDINWSIPRSKIYGMGNICSEMQEIDSAIIQKYIKDKMPIFNSIDNEKDYRVKILYDRYLKYIKDSNNVFSISSFLEFIGYKFSKLPDFLESRQKEQREAHIYEALDKIFDEFRNTYLSDINNVSSPNKELSFSELLSELNKLHDKIFLLDNLKDTDYTKSSRFNLLNSRIVINKV